MHPDIEDICHFYQEGTAKVKSPFESLRQLPVLAIGQKVKEYRLKNPDCKIISLGIGDVTRPLVDEVVRSMEEAVAEMAAASTFRGYGDEQGYLFLRQAICGYYAKKNVCLHEDEVFISDGAKSDLGNILDIFSEDNTVLIPDPSYPVYADSNMMAEET